MNIIKHTGQLEKALRHLRGTPGFDSPQAELVLAGLKAGRMPSKDQIGLALDEAVDLLSTQLDDEWEPNPLAKDIDELLVSALSNLAMELNDLV